MPVFLCLSSLNKRASDGSASYFNGFIICIDRTIQCTQRSDWTLKEPESF